MEKRRGTVGLDTPSAHSGSSGLVRPGRLERELLQPPVRGLPQVKAELGGQGEENLLRREDRAWTSVRRAHKGDADRDQLDGEADGPPGPG